jgi:hypothetical protein
MNAIELSHAVLTKTPFELLYRLTTQMLVNQPCFQRWLTALTFHSCSLVFDGTMRGHVVGSAKGLCMHCRLGHKFVNASRIIFRNKWTSHHSIIMNSSTTSNSLGNVLANPLAYHSVLTQCNIQFLDSSYNWSTAIIPLKGPFDFLCLKLLNITTTEQCQRSTGKALGAWGRYP